MLPTPLLLVAAIAAALALPSSASAAQTFGSDLSGTSFSNVGACTGANGCTFVQYDNLTPTYTSPIAGVIVRWRIRAGSAGSPVKLRVLRPSGIGFTGSGTTAQQLTSATGVDTFATRLAVRAGDAIGIDNSTEALLLAQAAAPLTVRAIQPPLADGATGSTNGSLDQANRALQINADVEPDADGDTYGDETQDQCPGDTSRQATPCGTGPPNPGATPPPPAPKPLVTGARVTPSRFRLGSLARIRFTLSTAAGYDLTLDQAVAGRRRGRRCVRQSRTVRTGRRCTAYVLRGTLEGAGRAGANALAFRGRIGRRALPLGRYRVTFSATDSLGETSTPRIARFTLRARLARR
jgi:hypothetical protein